MATTTNYAWETPDDTDLVKDGAAAIRTLGSSVDTTTKALNPSTTLGDIEYRSATANTNTRLGIGTSGQVLAVSGGVPAWATPAAGGGITQLATTTLSGTSVTFNSINQTYKELRLVLSGCTNTAGAGWIASLQLNGVTTSTYAYSAIQAASSSVSASAANYTAIRMAGANPSANSSTYNLTVTIPNYAFAGGHSLTWQAYNDIGGDNPSVFGVGGNLANTAAITSITFFDSYGNRTFNGGTLTLFGVN
jgi:hypothetical protein